MNTLQYRIHLLLHSKYRVLIQLFWMFIILFFYNNVDYTYCIDENQSTSLTDKTIGMSMFLGSILLILFLQSCSSNGGGDPSAIIDMTMQLCDQGLLENVPEFLDDFTINEEGKLYIGDVNVNTQDLYLNADVALAQIKKLEQTTLETRTQRVLTESYHILRDLYYEDDAVFKDVTNLEEIMPIHVEQFEKVMHIYNRQSNELKNLAAALSSFETLGIITPEYGLIYQEFLKSEASPEEFHAFLLEKLVNYGEEIE